MLTGIFLIYCYVGAGSVFDLTKLFSYHINLKDELNKFYDQEIAFRIDMEMSTPGSPEWCMLQMKRLALISETKQFCFQHQKDTICDPNSCQYCHVPYTIDNVTSSKVCKSCGHCVDILIDHVYDHSSSSRYNSNRIHHYDPTEHFNQTLCDFTCTGAREIPSYIFQHCLNMLGRGPDVTSFKVFQVLQQANWSRYYLHKYEITNRLRGTAEFTVSSREIEQMKDVYRRFRGEFIPFQEMHRIGTYSKNGKPRIYWPMKFILAKICQEIGRDDLVKFIRDVRNKKKFKNYEFYWGKLKTFLDNTRPKRDLRDPSSLAVPLRPKRRIL